MITSESYDRERLFQDRIAPSSDQLLQSITENSSSISIIATDLDHNIVYWNRGAERLWGYRAEEVIGKRKITILYEPLIRTQKALAEAHRFVLSTRRGTTCEVVQITRDGRSLWTKLNLNPRFGESGEIVGMMGIGQDITTMRQTERKLEHSLRKVRRAVNSTIHAMSLTVEKKDPFTAGHQRRTTDLARAIATEMKLSDEVIEGLRMAGVIHDLGKIYIPSDILNKPGALNCSEVTFIKSHPEVGYDIIKYIDFPWPIGKIILQHHERLDGSGYPHGLRGDQICLEARILMVADVVESMSSHRPYRPALGLNCALKEISRNRGRLYDPRVVDACIRICEQDRLPQRFRDGALA